MKRICTGILAVVLLLSAFGLCSCKPNKEGSTNTGNIGSNKQEEIAFPSRDYDWTEYRVLCTTQCESLYQTDEANTGTVVGAAVYTRNMNAEEKYHVQLTFKAMEGRSAGRDAFATAIRTTTVSGDGAYDLVIGQTYYTMALALEGLYYNMVESEYLNLDQPWYDGELVNRNINIADKLYAASGSYVISQITTAMALYYNKNMYDAYGCADVVDGQDIYDVVRNKEWTYEKLYEMVTSVYVDADNDQKVSKGDTYGFVGNVHAKMCALVGSDTPFTEADANGELSVSNYYNDHLLSVFDTYYNFFNDNESVYYVASDEGLIEFFANAQSLFCCNAVEYLAMSVVRDSGLNYGVLPFPMYDDQQENYYTNNIRWEIAHIPVSCDTERSAILFEYLNYISYRNLIPAYFDEVLSTQAVQVEEDSEMLYLIRNCIRFDFATFYQAQIGNSESDNIYGGVRDLIHKKNTNISSWWDSNKELYERSLTDLIDTYRYFLE